MTDTSKAPASDFLEELMMHRKAQFEFYDSATCERIVQCILSSGAAFSNHHLDSRFEETLEKTGLSGFSLETLKQFVGVMSDSSIGSPETNSEFFDGANIMHEWSAKRGLHIIRVFKHNLIIISALPYTNEQKLKIKETLTRDKN
jgi:hypothetical protein